jgi:hypothetical protein
VSDRRPSPDVGTATVTGSPDAVTASRGDAPFEAAQRLTGPIPAHARAQLDTTTDPHLEEERTQL